MRTTLNLDGRLVEEAQRLTGITEKTALLRAGLEALIGQASARLLAAQGVPVLPLGRAEADLLAAGTANRLSQELRPDDAVVVI